MDKAEQVHIKIWIILFMKCIKRLSSETFKFNNDSFDLRFQEFFKIFYQNVFSDYLFF